MYGFLALERKYGVTVLEEGEFYHPLKRRHIKTYKLLSADGEVWEKGIAGRDAVKREILTWSDQLLAIKNGTARVHNITEAYIDILGLEE